MVFPVSSPALLPAADLPKAVSTADWLAGLKLENIKDSMMLTAMTFLLFGNAMSDNVRTQTKIITGYSDRMLKANDFMAQINVQLGNTGVTDAAGSIGHVANFRSQAEAVAWCDSLVSVGGTKGRKGEGNPSTAEGIWIQVQTNGTFNVEAGRTMLNSINNNLQLSINNFSSLSQQAQLVMQQGNTRMGAAMDYVTAALEKWGKLSQSFIDNMRR